MEENEIIEEYEVKQEEPQQEVVEQEQEQEEPKQELVEQEQEQEELQQEVVEQEQEQEEPKQELVEQEQEQEEPQQEVVEQEQEQEEPQQEVVPEEKQQEEKHTGEEENEEDSFINALRRLVRSSDTDNSEEEEENEISVDNVELQNNDTVQTIDYSSQLQSILTEIGITNNDLEEFIETYTEQNETNNINAALNSQSCTNVLLIVIITLMLSKFTVHLVRGIL